MTFTVIGTWLDGMPVVAAVIVGDHDVYGSGMEALQNGAWAIAVEAENVDQAEDAARDQVIKDGR